jgi:hypothetical protein
MILSGVPNSVMTVAGSRVMVTVRSKAEPASSTSTIDTGAPPCVAVTLNSSNSNP